MNIMLLLSISELSYVLANSSHTHSQMFQSRILQSQDPLTIVFSFNQIPLVQRSVCPCSTFMVWKVSLLQTRIEWSAAHESIFELLGENSQALMGPLWPKYFATVASLWRGSS